MSDHNIYFCRDIRNIFTWIYPLIQNYVSKVISQYNMGNEAEFGYHIKTDLCSKKVVRNNNNNNDDNNNK